MKDFFRERRPHEGLSYETYCDIWKAEKEVEIGPDLSPDERKLRHYVRYNYDRSQQVHERYTPSEELRRALADIEEPQLWMVLTENWCGDSAFCLPVIAEAASESDAVTLRILPRDENLDIMDQYLTDGSRSIPRLVAFSEAGEELFGWGPRPQAAQERYDEAVEETAEKEEIVKHLLAYYEAGGWQDVDDELAAALAGGAGRRTDGELRPDRH